MVQLEPKMAEARRLIAATVSLYASEKKKEEARESLTKEFDALIGGISKESDFGRLDQFIANLKLDLDRIRTAEANNRRTREELYQSASKHISDCRQKGMSAKDVKSHSAEVERLSQSLRETEDAVPLMEYIAKLKGISEEYDRTHQKEMQRQAERDASSSQMSGYERPRALSLEGFESKEEVEQKRKAQKAVVIHTKGKEAEPQSSSNATPPKEKQGSGVVLGGFWKGRQGAAPVQPEQEMAEYHRGKKKPQEQEQEPLVRRPSIRGSGD